MKQEELSLIEFQKKFSTEQACREHLRRMRWPEGYKCPRCGHKEASFHKKRHLYQCKTCKYQVSLTAGTIFHKTRTPLRKWFWMILLMGHQKSGISMLSFKRLLEIKSYQTVWAMGHKIRKAMAERDAQHKLAGLIEMDDSYFGGTKPGKRGRGAGGKAKVIVAVETKGNRSGFAKMHQVERISSKEIERVKDNLERDATISTDGWRSYRVLNDRGMTHKPIVVGSSEAADKVLPWVHTLLGNVKGNIRGVHHGVGSKHLGRYLAEYCYRFNRRFWESQIFNRVLNACVNTHSITYAELTV